MEVKSLAKRHEAGVLAFCQRENAYPAGATGEKYNGICPSKLEKNFLPEFNRGRRSFIEATIASNEMAINDLETFDLGSRVIQDDGAISAHDAPERNASRADFDRPPKRRDPNRSTARP